MPHMLSYSEGANQHYTLGYEIRSYEEVSFAMAMSLPHGGAGLGKWY